MMGMSFGMAVTMSPLKKGGMVTLSGDISSTLVMLRQLTPLPSTGTGEVSGKMGVGSVVSGCEVVSISKEG